MGATPPRSPEQERRPMSTVLDAQTLTEDVRDVVHLDTQRASVGLDLTVASVHRLTGSGSVDFGGSEHEPASLEEVEAEVRHDGDEHGWWKLPAGTYVIRFNERLELGEGRWAHVLPLPRLLLAGAAHAAFLVDESHAGEPVQTLLTVGEAGCGLKENARVSRAVVMQR